MKKSLLLALSILFALPMTACSKTGTTAPGATAASGAMAAPAADAAIRKNLQERLPQLPPIEEIRATAMPGLYEVRVGPAGIFYTDAQGDFLIQGAMMDTKARRNLTEERINALNAIDFSTLPLKDAIVFKSGNGRRKLAVFEDPNCSYCHRLETELAKVKNLTVYMFLYPILGPDSTAKSQNIWCAANRTKAWQDWMLRQKTPAAAQCDTAAVQRILEFGRGHRITGTPTIVFEDGRRVSGAMDAAALENMLEQKP
jgi:thiol:disulfide interchange protein DsbC